MLKRILGNFCSLPSGVSPRLEWGHAHVVSSRSVAAVSRFPSRGSRDQGLSLQAFPRGLPTGLCHVPPWCESILGLKVEALQGKQVSLEWTDIWGTLAMLARPSSSSRLSCGERLLLRCDGNAGNSFPSTQGKDSSSRAWRRKRSSSGGCRTLVLPLEWRRVCRGTS